MDDFFISDEVFKRFVVKTDLELHDNKLMVRITYSKTRDGDTWEKTNYYTLDYIKEILNRFNFCIFRSLEGKEFDLKRNTTGTHYIFC